jgi:hypothetical protein
VAKFIQFLVSLTTLPDCGNGTMITNDEFGSSCGLFQEIIPAFSGITEKNNEKP